MTPISPQEVYLLERFVSLDYFGDLRDTWAEMVAHVEKCLKKFMQALPPRYRARALSEQPDIVWGERVLPNFRDTLIGLNIGFTLVAHGDMSGLHYAHGPINDHKGQMDFWAGWMNGAERDIYDQLLEKATTMAHNIALTEGAYWDPGTLTDFPESLGHLNPPPAWPNYRVNPTVSVKTGDKTTQNGIYLPDLDASCAQFLSTKYDSAPKATVVSGTEDLIDPTTGQKEGERLTFAQMDCTWYLVERTLGIAQAPLSEQTQVLRVTAGEKCPEAGFYFTPAHPGSRRRFSRGEFMPALGKEYGATIWQWDSNQT